MPWDLIWVAILFGGFLIPFGVFEIISLRRGVDPDNPKAHTLTASVRRWAGIAPARWWRWLTIPALAVLFAWLPIHFLTPWL